jgi:DNA-binding response OmpR family regulator
MIDNTPSDEKNTIPPMDKFVYFSRPKKEKGPILSDRGQSDNAIKQIIVLLALNQTDSESLALALKLAGCAVIVTGDVRSTISEFSNRHPDIVVLDYGSASGDSIQVAKQILSIRSATKIIMILGNEGASKEAEGTGVELFLKRPLSIKRTVDSIIAVSKLSPPRSIMQK